MICREMLKLEHPECVREYYQGGCKGCPHVYGYLNMPDYCSDDINACNKCWDREIPEESLKGIRDIGCKGEPGDPGIGRPTTLNVDLRELLDATKKSVDENIKKVEEANRPKILDSGNRTVFESGAVRDIQEGKGRCDLLPLDVVGEYWDDPVFSFINEFQETGQYGFLISALMEIEHRVGFPNVPTMLLEVGVHFEDGAKKYGPNNWRRGIPVSRYIDSGVRHYIKCRRGDTDERHDRAACWNILCAIWTCKHMPELNEYPIKFNGDANAT